MSGGHAVNDASIVFELSGQFVLDHVVPTPAELVCGYRLGWIAPQVAVRLALAGLEVIPDLPTSYEDLALLLSDQLDQVPQLMDALGRAADPTERDAQVWLFLVLCWVFKHRTEFSDPFSIVERLYDDFNFPEEIEGFVRFFPVAGDSPTGEAALFDRWAKYLETASEKYRRRFK